VEAVGLRDQRLAALTELSQLINIKTKENPDSKAVSIYCGADALLADGVKHTVSVNVKENNDASSAYKLGLAELYVADNHSNQPPARLDVKSGAVYGLYQAHTEVLGNYLDNLNDLTQSLISEFNGIYTSGQGLTGFTKLNSLAVENAASPLGELFNGSKDSAATVENGAFFVQLYRKEDDGRYTLVKDKQINVQVNDPTVNDPFSITPAPLGSGTTLQDIAAAINAIDGMTASIDNLGELQIQSDDPNYVFAFSEDSSGALAALGLNTFFTGNTAGNIGINQTVIDNPSAFAASQSGIGQDVDNGVSLSAMSFKPNRTLNGASIRDYYGGLVSETMLAAGTAKAVAKSDTLYQQSLQAQRDAVSGVNIDEETITMMMYQRMFQANSRIVTMIDEMLSTLIAM
jgi:flagellar hook-associated protein 1 FlgK